ncbi:MAG: hypothetical protein ABJA16_09040, partial [Nakamurella sp.]
SPFAGRGHIAEAGPLSFEVHYASASVSSSPASAAGRRINTEFGGLGVGSTTHHDMSASRTGRPGRRCT